MMMNRRQLLLTLAALGSMQLHAADAPLPLGVDHVSLGVVDLERSLAFYARLFGGARRVADGSVWLPLGSSFLQLQQADTASVLRQGLAIAAAQLSVLDSWLGTQGLRWERDGAVVQVCDKDGVWTRLGPALDWPALGGTAAPGTAVMPLFQPLLVDELALAVTNMQVDSMFYARLLGQTSTVVAGSQFFRLGPNARLRLSQAAVGQPTGFSYFAVLIGGTDLEAAAEAVFQAGGIIESFLPNGFSFWDPDGLRVVLRTAPQVLGAPAGPLEN